MRLALGVLACVAAIVLATTISTPDALPPPPSEAPERGAFIGLAPPTAEVVVPPPEADQLGFVFLASFPYPQVATADQSPPPVPLKVMAYEGRVIRVEGHMLPLTQSGGKVTEFVLSRYMPGCCFQGAPRINEWVEVRTAEAVGLPPSGLQRVIVTGALEIGPELDDKGYVTSVYRMKATRVELAPKAAHVIPKERGR